ncbi:MAG: hypothetical protein ACYC2I_12710 [Elusimicrobiales bacterium]
MHILPGILTLLLLPAPALAATPFDKMVGDWAGAVVSDDGCEWKVRSAVKSGSSFSGDFTYDGECAKGPARGTFRIKPSGKSCYAATVNVAKLPPMPVSGCADKAGNITFKTVGFSGKLTFTKGNKTFSLTVDAEQGSAKGQFRRLGARKKQRGPAQAKAKIVEEERMRSEDAVNRDAEGRGRPAEEEEEDGYGAPAGGEKERRDEGNSSEILIGGY